MLTYYMIRWLKLNGNEAKTGHRQNSSITEMTVDRNARTEEELPSK
jgi:hypothetical protein